MACIKSHGRMSNCVLPLENCVANTSQQFVKTRRSTPHQLIFVLLPTKIPVPNARSAPPLLRKFQRSDSRLALSQSLV